MASNPQLMQMLAALAARSGGAPGGAPGAVAGGPPGAPGAPPGGAPPGAGAPGGDAGGGPGGGDNTGGDYSSMLSDLRRADPQTLMRQLHQMKSIFAVLMVHYLESLPNVAGRISKVIPHIDNVIKEAEKAASVSGAVRNPIAMGAAQPTPQSPNASGGPTGPMGV